MEKYIEKSVPRTPVLTTSVGVSGHLYLRQVRAQQLQSVWMHINLSGQLSNLPDSEHNSHSHYEHPKFDLYVRPRTEPPSGRGSVRSERTTLSSASEQVSDFAHESKSIKRCISVFLQWKHC